MESNERDLARVAEPDVRGERLFEFCDRRRWVARTKPCQGDTRSQRRDPVFLAQVSPQGDRLGETLDRVSMSADVVFDEPKPPQQLGLTHAIGVTIVDPKMGDDGWALRPEDPDPIGPSTFLRDVYVRADAHYTGRVTVPVLWDRAAGTIANNESRELMKLLDRDLAPVA